MKDFIGKVKGYFTEVKGEARRVSWPGKQELYDSTLVVIAFIFILAVTTFACDTGIRWVLTVLFPDVKA
ncbi:MAG: preprotein translocase subunit SecE [Verrucomicrobiota bacterium]|nr:preprotein translocase subunit SecE [Verrucomicrobiota bacterium]